jgi:hypothetical protein
MNFVKENIIYKAENRTVLYHSVIKCLDGIVRMYVNEWNRKNQTIFYESHDNGKTFNLKPKLVIKGSGISHNFYPFHDKDKKCLFAIGGVDSWKHQQRWRDITDFEEFKKAFLERFNTPYIKDSVRWEGTREKLLAKGTLNHVDGLYLLKSKDGIKWDLVEKEPIIKAILPKHPGFWSALEWGKSTEFDGHLTCLYDSQIKRYILWVRKNIRWGIRFVQYATSKDLINWSEFKSINVDGHDPESDNYYSPVFMKHPDNDKLFIGMVPFFPEKGGNGCIKIMKSYDGINWEVTDEIFKKKVSLLNKKPKNQEQAINGIVREGKSIYFYIHHNYLGVNELTPVKICRYELRIKELNRSLNL